MEHAGSQTDNSKKANTCYNTSTSAGWVHSTGRLLGALHEYCVHECLNSSLAFGWLCEYMGTKASHCAQKNRTDPSVGRSRVRECGTSGHAAALLRPERAALALWATPAHASSMVGSTADDHLTVNGDAMFVVGADPEHAARTLPPERRRPADC